VDFRAIFGKVLSGFSVRNCVKTIGYSGFLEAPDRSEAKTKAPRDGGAFF
jgi:hypothetical protein